MPSASKLSSAHVRISGLGYGAFFLIIMISAAAINTGTNLLYLMLSALLSFWTFSIIAGWANNRGLEVIRHLPPEAHARQSSQIEYEIRNIKRRLPTFGVSLRDEVDSPDRTPISAHFISIPARSQSRKEAEFRPHRRGILKFSRIRMVSSFPFGFIDFIRQLKSEAKLLVYPELIPVSPQFSARAVELGMEDSRLRGHGSNLYAIRDYAPGDPARSIHWKLSAKGMGVKIRETEREESQRVRIVLDFPLRKNAGAEEMERFELAVSAAASLADLFLKRGLEMMLWTPRGVVPPGSGERQWRQVMTALALVDVTDWMNEGQTPRPPSGGEFMEIGVNPETLDGICAGAAEKVA